MKTQIFFYEYGLRPHVSSVFYGRIPKFLQTLYRVETFLSDTNTYTCRRSYPEICQYACVILLDPVFTASIINAYSKIVSSLLIALISSLISCVQINEAVINLLNQCLGDPSRCFWRIASFLYSFVIVSSSSTSLSDHLYASAYFFLTFSEDLDIFLNDKLQASTVYTLQ